MDVALKGCACEGLCGCNVPAEFVRLRYYFGQRLGVVDLSDEQSYHAGKQRFHNLRAHGYGVLCGLRADRYVFPQGAPPNTPTTVLRVTSGAALDGCGRELIVPGDQCIDVAAWFLKNRRRASVAALAPGAAAPAAAAPAGAPAGAVAPAGAPAGAVGGLIAAGPAAAAGAGLGPGPAIGPPGGGAAAVSRLWVAIRYRECPSDPGAAPRDPCGCDDGACEYGRVREGFELSLLTERERKCVTGTFPPRADLHALLDSAPSDPSLSVADRWARALKLLLASGCPDVAPECWLCLASFTVTFDSAPDGTPIIVDVGAPDNAIPERESILTTAALQELIGTVVAASSDGSALTRGPQLGELSWTNATKNTGTLLIPIALVTDPAPGGQTPIDGHTFDPATVSVEQYDNTGWSSLSIGSVNLTAASQLELKWTAAKKIGEGNYRVCVEQPLATPMVDTQMRAVQPLRYARHLHLKLDNNNVLTSVDTLV
jgi:hypothetical protein